MIHLPDKNMPFQQYFYSIRHVLEFNPADRQFPLARNCSGVMEVILNNERAKVL